MQLIPVILSGGSGTRLWPLSRSAFPKQFLPLAGDRSMLLQTMDRLQGVTALAAPIVVCNERHRFLVAEQLQQGAISGADILLEPVGRNTAPALVAAAHAAQQRGGDPVLLVLPADHLIQDVAAFQHALTIAVEAAEAGGLVTFGVVPQRPETGYGYIRTAATDDEAGARAVAAFVEKPDLATAEHYLERGDYYWNSGMFLFRASRYLEELAQHAPQLLAQASSAWEQRREDMDFVRLDATAFSHCPSDSIDYALMEKTAAAVMVPLQAGWSDIGSWSALLDIARRSDEDNVVIGDVITHDTHGSYIRAEERLVATVGVRDHVVVETKDAILVAHRDRVQDVKQIVAQLQAQGRDESDFHRRVFRPWGWFEGIARAERFQVKHIMVKPGARLSLQMHHHRAEHWIVVSGTARVTCGDQSRLLSEDQSTYIPLGTPHRLENPGVIPLELIEVQSGSYLGEDDIVRYEDLYGRSNE